MLLSLLQIEAQQPQPVCLSLCGGIDYYQRLRGYIFGDLHEPCVYIDICIRCEKACDGFEVNYEGHNWLDGCFQSTMDLNHYFPGLYCRKTDRGKTNVWYQGRPSQVLAPVLKHLRLTALLYACKDTPDICLCSLILLFSLRKL